MSKLNKYKSDILSMLSSNLVVGVINIVSIALITSAYDPQDFGAYQVFFSIVAILSVISSLKYDFFIVSSKSDLDRLNSIVISFLFLIVFTICTALLVFFLKAEVNSYIKNEIPYVNILIPLTVLLSGTIQIITALFVSNNSFKYLAKLKIYQATIINVGFVVGGIYYPTVQALILSFTISQLLTGLYLVASLKDKSIDFNLVKLKEIYSFEKIKRKYSLLTTLNTLLNVVSINLPYFIIPVIFKIEYVGVFAIALKIMDMPIGLLTSSISNVYIKYAADAYNRGDGIYERYKETIVSLIPFAAAYIVACLLFYFTSDIFFKEDWNAVKDIIIIMLVPKIAQLMNSPVSSTLTIMNKQIIITLVIVICIILRILSFYITDNYNMTVCYYSISTALYYISINIITYGFIRHDKRKN